MPSNTCTVRNDASWTVIHGLMRHVITRHWRAEGKRGPPLRLAPLSQRLVVRINANPFLDHGPGNGEMTRSESLAQAEKMVLEGSNESQDSQAIFDAHQARFGAATVRTRSV